MSHAIRRALPLGACLTAVALACCSNRVAPPPMDPEMGWTCQVSRGAEFRDLGVEETKPFIAFYNELKLASWKVPGKAKRTTQTAADYRVLFAKPAGRSRPGQNASTYILVYLPQQVDVDGGGLFEVKPEGIRRLTDAIRAHLGGDASFDRKSSDVP